jgi:hypothetical protein
MSGPLDLPSAPLATGDQRSDPATDPRGRGLGAPRRSAIWWLPRARGPRCTRSRSGDALVTVMEPADLGDGANPAAGRRLDVAIPKQVLRGGLFREGLDDLASRPGGRGMVRDVEVDQLAAVMAKRTPPRPA